MMDTKISLALLAAATTVFLVVGIANVKGTKTLLLNKPFFSNNVHKSKALKNINVVEATETTTSVADSPDESKTTTNVMKTFTCTSQKGDNTTKGKPTPITLHQTPITTSLKASTSYSLDDITAVSTGVHSASSPDEIERTTTDIKNVKKSTKSSTLESEVFTKSVTTLPMEMATKVLSTPGTLITSSPSGFTSHILDATTVVSGGVDNVDSLTTADKATSTENKNVRKLSTNPSTLESEVFTKGVTTLPMEMTTKARSTPGTLITSSPSGFTSHILDATTVVSGGVDNADSLTTADETTSTGAECKSVFNKKFNNSCYKFVDSKSTRSEARSACKGDSSHLAYIETEEENDFLVGKTDKDKEYWIGIHERPNLFWDNGNQVTFANIDPDNDYTFDDDTGCYKMSTNDGRYWLDIKCTEQFSYICECEGAGCPSEYDIEFETSSYKFVNHPGVTMSEARSACKGDSSHLVFIETKEENDFLVEKTKNDKEYWIGIHERPNLFWDNGNQVTFANIDPDNDRTFNSDTGCYKMSDNEGRYWLDGDCSDRYGYICEYKCY